MIGVDLQDGRFLDVLKQYFGDLAPEGYCAWLERNLTHYDPISRGWRLRDGLPLSFRTQHSFKCWDDRCMHYIYGYSHQDDRDQHARDHVLAGKRDSGLSIGETPPMVFSDHSAGMHSADVSKHESTRYLPRPGSNYQLAPLITVDRSHERDSLRTYSFASEFPAGPRGSVDSDVDPLLPPLKRSRVGQPRLESIGELRLLKGSGPCLRCKVLGNPVRRHRVERASMLAGLERLTAMSS